MTAIHVTFLLFDLWGEHLTSLGFTEILDLKAGQKAPFSAQWNLHSEHDCSAYYASIAYVSRVRTADGRVLRADTAAVLKEARRFSEKFSEEKLTETAK